MKVNHVLTENSKRQKLFICKTIFRENLSGSLFLHKYQTKTYSYEIKSKATTLNIIYSNHAQNLGNMNQYAYIHTNKPSFLLILCTRSQNFMLLYVSRRRRAFAQMKILQQSLTRKFFPFFSLSFSFACCKPNLHTVDGGGSK